MHVLTLKAGQHQKQLYRMHDIIIMSTSDLTPLLSEM